MHSWQPCVPCFRARSLANVGKLSGGWNRSRNPWANRKTGPNGLPTISNAAVRELLVSAVSDPNVWIGDKAYRQLAMFDFYHAARPGECIEIVPSVRRSARWTAREAKAVSVGGPVGGSFDCIP